MDGKRVQARGVMGNVELQMDHGDSLKANFTMKGIQQGYTDTALPGTPNEAHFVPPTFLGGASASRGLDFRLSYFDGSNTRIYGRDSAASYQLGAISTSKISPGNEVILRPNSLDAAGISFAIIVDRAGEGSFDPDEVLSGAPDNFDFITRFIAGQQFRMHAFIGSRQGVAAFPADGNSIDIIVPGVVFTGMADAEREKVNIWDASFALTGGDYDATASGELPGNDNELTLIYR
jgi:hypothetical protein